MKNLRAAYGQYALVTGASAGIGEQFARQLSAAGINVVLVARRKDRLEALASELSRAHGTDNVVIALDLLSDAAVDELARRVGDLDVGIVVANAGIPSAGVLVNSSIAYELEVLTLDAVVPLQMAHVFGNALVRRGRGAVVLVASSLEASAVPYVANYAAAKAYVSLLGQALHYELKRDGVDVLVLSPGMTKTEIAKRSSGLDLQKISGPRMAAAPVVEAALNNLGKRARVVPGGSNRLVDLLIKLVIPRSLSAKMFGWLFGRALFETTPHKT
ncbi:SDR family NAD(P)-dependent oxidoreductase [Mycobacterium helveticum]|uniref:SDR family NAD(P)-dependent oxidoreductase n=2 Tax=Mycobacterium helveticum TaxID=2592811 RepID=A0A557XHL6_9MYCO|nr:SDR family NAD(P)-dependent oxidoreductase [Mycobacterium helveticum]TVS85179.1 SDR family NAD(P)-dependent oxidoreductase [Mycobacterium helveticum]